MKQIINEIRGLDSEETEALECAILEHIEDRVKREQLHWIVIKAREYHLMEPAFLIYWYRQEIIHEELVLLFRELKLLLAVVNAVEYQRITKPEFRALWDHFERKIENQLLDINVKSEG